MALLIVPIVGAFALGTEAADWYVNQRAVQNAVDASAIAAATNGTTNEATKCTTVKDDFCFEGRGAAAKYGFTDGINNTTVTVSYADVSAGGVCPGGATACYTATITKKLPIYLSKLVGFRGDTTIGAARAQTILASAVVSRGKPVDYCMITLGTGDSFVLKGGPNADMPGCDLRSNGNLSCSGHTMPSSPFGDAVGTSTCGGTPRGGQATQPDPEAALNANPPIPANPCATYPQATGTSIAAAQTITPATSFASPVLLCGNSRLNQGDINITTPNAVLVVYNGSLDLQGHTLSTSGSGSLTIILSGPPGGNTSGSYSHVLTGSGTIDIAAPGRDSGSLFSGVAIMQDKRQNTAFDNNDMSAFGNTPNLAIQGLIYMPNANLDFRGAINLHNSGLQCIGIIAKTLTVKGTGSLLGNGFNGQPTVACPLAGLDLPTAVGSTSRNGLALVQ
jgi:hypothetical protein